MSHQEVHVLNIPMTWHFIAFVAAPEIERTETVDFILQFALQPSTFLITESPELGSSSQHCSSFLVSLSHYFFSLYLLFSFAKSERLPLWCSFFVSIFGLLSFHYLPMIYYIRHYIKYGATTWFFSVRDLMISVLIMFFFS